MADLGIYGLQTEAESFASVTETLLNALEMCHPGVGLRAHAERVAGYASQLARHLGVGAIASDQLHYGALLHDIGKIALPTNLLVQRPCLSPEERLEFKNHTLNGERLCRSLVAARPLLIFIRSHHEKLDGSGYPDKLTKDYLPLPVQILAVANIYDTLRSERPTQPAFEHKKVMTILRHEVARGWWNAEAVDLMNDCGQEVEIK